MGDDFEKEEKNKKQNSGTFFLVPYIWSFVRPGRDNAFSKCETHGNVAHTQLQKVTGPIRDRLYITRYKVQAYVKTEKNSQGQRLGHCHWRQGGTMCCSSTKTQGSTGWRIPT